MLGTGRGKGRYDSLIGRGDKNFPFRPSNHSIQCSSTCPRKANTSKCVIAKAAKSGPLVKVAGCNPGGGFCALGCRGAILPQFDADLCALKPRSEKQLRDKYSPESLHEMQRIANNINRG
jgi:hypothetical protein